MEDLIQALLIFNKYSKDEYPSRCDYEVFHICISPRDVSKDDISKLEKLGFEADYENDDFFSYRFGSC